MNTIEEPSIQQSSLLELENIAPQANKISAKPFADFILPKGLK